MQVWNIHWLNAQMPKLWKQRIIIKTMRVEQTTLVKFTKLPFLDTHQPEDVVNTQVELIHWKNSPPVLVNYSITFHFIILQRNSRCLQHLCSYAQRAVLNSTLIPLIAHYMELVRDPLRQLQNYPPRAFLPNITTELSKPHLPGLVTLAKGKTSSSKYKSLNSPLLCPWILLSENKIMYLIFKWRITVSFFTHCKFVFKDNCQQSAKSHSFSFLTFAYLLTGVLLTWTTFKFLI